MSRRAPVEAGAMKLLWEILLSVFLHPIAMVLMWINIIGRSDLNTLQKIVWVVVSIIWGWDPSSISWRAAELCGKAARQT